MSEATYCTDADVLVVDAYAEKLLKATDVEGDPAVKTFARHRLRAKQEIDKQLARREPPVEGSIGEQELRDCEVYMVLGHAYREQASSGTKEDRFLAQAEYFEEKAAGELENYRGNDGDPEDAGSIGGSIPFFRC